MEMYRYLVVIGTATTGLTTFCDLCYLMTYLMIELPTYLSSYVAYTYNIYHNTEMPSSVTLNPAYPYVSMRIYAYPYMSIYTYLI